MCVQMLGRELFIQTCFFNSVDKYVIKYVRQNEAHVFRCLDSHMQVLIDIYLVSYITDHMAPHPR